MKVLHVVTVADSLIFLTGRSHWMALRGVQSEVACSPDSRLAEYGRVEGVVTHPVPIRRAISPATDVITILRLIALMRRRRPEIVHSHTPKGGMVGIIAACLARVPVRIYHIHGLPFETKRGLQRRLLMASEWLSCRLATEVMAVSPSVLDVARRRRLCSTAKGVVAGHGSINGVDLKRFDPHQARDAGEALRVNLGIPGNSYVIGYVGRLVADKGLETLAKAWVRLRSRHPHAVLLVVGGWDPNDPVPANVLAQLQSDDRVFLAGHLENPTGAYSLMTVLTLPSRREGFGLVAIEAAAMEVPVVGTDVTGLRDAIVHGQTGTLVPVDAPAALTEAISLYLESPALRDQHGCAGRIRARSAFQPEVAWDQTLHLYSRLLGRQSA